MAAIILEDDDDEKYKRLLCYVTCTMRTKLALTSAQFEEKVGMSLETFVIHMMDSSLEWAESGNPDETLH